MDEDKREGCECSDENEYHACPYASDVGGNDSEDYCNCCKECTYQCAQDI